MSIFGGIFKITLSKLKTDVYYFLLMKGKTGVLNS